MGVTYSTPSIHGVESLHADVLEFQSGYCLRLHLGEIDTMAIWFTGPLAKQRVESYAAAINSVHGLPLVIVDPIGASA